MSDSLDYGGQSTLGGALRAARESVGLSVADVAQRLFRTPAQIEALERNEFAGLPQGTYLRGFVTNYARIVGLDGERLLAALEDKSPIHRAPQLIVPSQNIHFHAQRFGARSLLVRPILGALLITAALLSAAYWYFIGGGDAQVAATIERVAAAVPATLSPSSASSSSAPAAAGSSAPKEAAAPATSAAQANGPTSPAAVVDSPVSKAMAPEAGEEKAAIEPAAKPPEREPGEVSLVFAFNGSSWVEVVDGNGRKVASQMNKAGSSFTVTARRPVSMVVGNSKEVTLTYNGLPIDLGPHTRVSVARLSLD